MDDKVQGLLQRGRYPEALNELLDRFEQKVFRMALGILKDRGRAEEVTQDVFLKIWRALPDYDGRAAPSTWLYTIARNTCLSALRHNAFRRTTPLEEDLHPGAVSHVQRDLALARCVAALPEVERLVITLFYWEDRSIADVARALDIPEGTVKSHLHRARRRLGEMME